MRIVVHLYCNLLAILAGYLTHKIYCDLGIYAAVLFVAIDVVVIVAVYANLEISIDSKRPP